MIRFQGAVFEGNAYRLEIDDSGDMEVVTYPSGVLTPFCPMCCTPIEIEETTSQGEGIGRCGAGYSFRFKIKQVEQPETVQVDKFGNKINKVTTQVTGE